MRGMTKMQDKKRATAKQKAKTAPAPTSGAANPLTPKQQCFVDEYLIDLNATRAAIRAGYSAKTAEQQGPRLLGNVGVKAAIDAAKEKRAERTNINADRVLNGISRLIDRCEQAEPVYDKEGVPTGEYTFKASEALRGYDLLGRHLGLWNDKLKLQGDAENPIQVAAKVVIVPSKETAKVETKPVERADD